MGFRTDPKPLSKEEAFALLRKYDETQQHAEALISELNDSNYERLKDLMVNPMLVSLLYKAYSYKPNMPFKKHIFYRQVFDALFDMHDSTKGGAFVRKKQCNLDIDEFHQVMRDLGFTTAKLGKIEYEKDEISGLIKGVRERNSTILFQPAALLKDLVTTVPLFNCEGQHYKWAHKSVQEYFASQFIALDAKGNQAPLLERIYDGGHCSRMENILDLLHDSDNRAFRRILLSRLLRDFVEHYETKYRRGYPGVSEAALEERRQLTFGGEVAVFVTDSSEVSKFLPKAIDRMEKAFRKMFVKKGVVQCEFYYYGDSLIGRKLVVGRFRTPAGGLLPLLASRGYSYVSRSFGIEPLFNGFPLNSSHVISDDPNAFENHPDYFEVVNGILRLHGYQICIEEVRRTLSSIREEFDEAAGVDQLLQNL